MLNDDRYNQWIRTRQQVTTGLDFSDAVMERIDRRDKRSPRRWTTVVTRVSETPWARAAALIVASVLGIGRILLTLHVLMFA